MSSWTIKVAIAVVWSCLAATPRGVSAPGIDLTGARDLITTRSGSSARAVACSTADDLLVGVSGDGLLEVFSVGDSGARAVYAERTPADSLLYQLLSFPCDVVLANCQATRWTQLRSTREGVWSLERVCKCDPSTVGNAPYSSISWSGTGLRVLTSDRESRGVDGRRFARLTQYSLDCSAGCHPSRLGSLDVRGQTEVFLPPISGAPGIGAFLVTESPRTHTVQLEQRYAVVEGKLPARADASAFHSGSPVAVVPSANGCLWVVGATYTGDNPTTGSAQADLLSRTADGGLKRTGHAVISTASPAPVARCLRRRMRDKPRFARLRLLDRELRRNESTGMPRPLGARWSTADRRHRFQAPLSHERTKCIGARVLRDGNVGVVMVTESDSDLPPTGPDGARTKATLGAENPRFKVELVRVGPVARFFPPEAVARSSNP